MVKLKSCLNYIVVLNLILLSGSLYSFYNFKLLFAFTSMLLMLSIAIQERKIFKELFIAVLFVISIIAVLVINLIFSPSNTISEVLTFFFLSLTSCLSYFNLRGSSKDISTIICFVLKMIAYISIVGWLLSYIPIWQDVVFENGFSQKSILFLHFFLSNESIGGIDFIRNGGFFWEPGVLSVYMNFFLLISLSVHKNYKNALLASFVILTTFSTTGVLMVGIQWFYVVARSNSVQKLKKIIIVFVLVVPFVFFGYTSLISKKNDDKTVTSYSMRTMDLYTGVMVTLEHPLIGIGLSKEIMYENLNKHFGLDIAQVDGVLDKRGNSNSISQLFMIFGIPLSIIFFILLYNQDIINNDKFLSFLIIIICLCNEPLIFTPFFLFLVYSGWHNLISAFKIKKRNLL